MFSQPGGKQGKKFSAAALSLRPGRAGLGRRICLVSDSSLDAGADEMARWLARDGWNVTLLDLATQGGKKARAYKHVKLAGTFSERNWYAPMRALCVYQWLKNRPYDCVLFQHGFGAGYFCGAAKALGVAFASTPLIVLAEEPFAYRLEKAGRMPSLATFRTDAEVDYFERMAVAHADGLLLRDKRVLDWMQEAGWALDKVRLRTGLLGKKGKPAGKWLTAPAKKPAKKPAGAMPLISVCVTGSGNAKCLEELLVSLRNQTLAKFEVFLTDSSSGALEKLKKKFAPVFKKRGWIWIKGGRDEIAARNAAAKKAKGSHLLFLDDDDELTPDALDIFARAAQANTADILVSVQGKHHNSDNTVGAFARLPARSGKSPLTVGWIYYGANLAISPCVNVIGDAGSLIRTDVFWKLGGFQGKPGDLYYGRNLLLHAAIKKYRIGVVPEILLLARRDKNYRHVWNENKFASELSSLAAALENVPPSLRPLFLPFLAEQAQKKPAQVAPVRGAKIKRRALAKLADGNGARVKIALCADENYLTQACVTIASILRSAKTPADIFLFSNAEKSRLRRAQEIAAQFGGKLTVMAPGKAFLKKLPPSMMWGKASNATYWRLELAERLPKLGRILYLDCDLLVRRDLGALFSAALGNNVLAAARDAFAHQTGTMAKDFGGDYFNAGVMLIDLAQWRRQDIGRKVWKAVAALEAENYPYRFHDQSPLNKAINGRWAQLPPTWNYYEGIDAHAGYFDLDSKALRRLKREAAICHFRAAKKPWQPDFDKNSAYTREYRDYLAAVEALMRSR